MPVRLCTARNEHSLSPCRLYLLEGLVSVAWQDGELLQDLLISIGKYINMTDNSFSSKIYIHQEASKLSDSLGTFWHKKIKQT